jgi:hypothetical protein
MGATERKRHVYHAYSHKLELHAPRRDLHFAAYEIACWIVDVLVHGEDKHGHQLHSYGRLADKSHRGPSPDSNPDPGPDAEADPHADAKADPDPDTHTQADPKAHTQADAEAGRRPEVDAQAHRQTNRQANGQADREARQGPGRGGGGDRPGVGRPDSR